MVFSLHRDCMGDDSSRRVVGVSAWCIAHVGHTRVNTSVGSVYVISWFSRYKHLYKCILFLKSIYILYKRTLVVSDLVLARWGSENVFDRPWVFKGKSKPQTVLWTFYINFVITVPFALFNLWDVLLNSSSTHV